VVTETYQSMQIAFGNTTVRWAWIFE